MMYFYEFECKEVNVGQVPSYGLNERMVLGVQFCSSVV